ncbi:MAG: hypothetical protein KGJ89_05270 [Patescibacteria group bacterium]|nr:hypothetical protein [Patescibacteria group bacterium]
MPDYSNFPKNKTGVSFQPPARSPDEGRPEKNGFHEKKKAAFGVNFPPYHVHNGTDAPRIPLGSVQNVSPYLSQQIAVYATGKTPVAVFGRSCPLNGHVTSFMAISNSATAGTVTLYGTTAGTIVSLGFSNVPGTVSAPSSNIKAAVSIGDTFTVTPTAGSVTCLVTVINS